MNEPMFDKVALIGVGLIGSSLCHAMRRAGLAGKIAASARTKKTRKTALELGLVDEVFEFPADAVRDADLVILCVPVGISGGIAQQIAGSLKPGAILTDVGSVKASVIEQIMPFLPEDVHFIPGHPVAGTEHSGPEAGFAELFDRRWCILTPIEGVEESAVQRLKTFWEKCGSHVELMSAQHHDLVLAVTSHLPHLIAFNIVGTATDLGKVTDSEVIQYAASGFRDFTRIAASDPVMWRDVFLHNKEAVLEVLSRFNEDISILTRAIRDDDAEKLEALITRTRKIRRDLLDTEAKEKADDAC